MKLYIGYIQELSDEMGKISGGWNGKDEKFVVEGHVYTEEDASWADDIVGKCNELIELLKEEVEK